MGKLRRFGVSLDEDLLLKFDNQISKEKYSTRSKAISDLINTYLLKKSKIRGGILAAAISLVYDHRKRMISETLTDIQHKYHNIIISSQHVHLDHDNCFEIVIVKGEAKNIEELFNVLKSVKGIRNAYLTVAGAAGDSTSKRNKTAKHFH
ncbi:MAG: nickel-responsive transcriptional regulator NikR [Elusimicrobiota bacterium]